MNHILEMSEASIEELVQAACLWAPRHERELINLPCVVEQVAAHFAGDADEKAVRICVDIAPDALLIGYVSDLRQAVAQLLSNALDETPCGGRVIVAGETSNGLVTLTVSSNERRHAARQSPHAWRLIPARWRETPHAPWEGQLQVEEIVEAHGGEVDTSWREGLRVVLRLPVHG